jgi:hypothetical protein
MTESFFHTLKGHVVHGCVFTTRKEVNTVLFDYIEIYYNRDQMPFCKWLVKPRSL